jgi:phospholipid/cholesterol/gamma-HCH transport system substrate-binding protein
MEYLKQEVKAGVLITVSFAILCFFLFNVTGMKARAEMNHYTVSFSNINGLMENAPVNYAGVKVGKVEWIAIKRHGDALVEVGISVKQSIPLCADSKVVISSAGFVGEKNIGITPGQTAGAPLKSGAVIRGVDPTDMVKLIERVNDVLDDLKVEHLGKKMEEMFTNANEVVLEAKDSMRSIRDVVQDVQQSGKVQKVLNDSAELIAKFQQFTDNVNGTVQDNRAAVKSAITNIEQLSSRMRVEGDKLLVQLKKILEEINGIVDENRSDIKQTVVNAKDFTCVVKHEPWRLFWKEDTDNFFKGRLDKKKEAVAAKRQPKKEQQKGFPFIF